MLQRLCGDGQIRPSKSLALACAIAAVIVAVPSQRAEATTNNSGRYVVAGENGVWRAVDDDTIDIAGSVFYPSWYVGVDLSQTKWDAKDFESESSGAGVVIGNHFHPHLRWELRHRYQEPEAEYSGVEAQTHTLSSLVLDYIVAEPADGFSPVLRGGVAQANGDGFADDQSDAAALLGLGMQWREDRWLVRMMLEQAGEDQQWGALTVAGYLGGGQSPKVVEETLPSPAKTYVAPAVIDDVVIEQPVTTLVPAEPVIVVDEPIAILEVPDNVVTPVTPVTPVAPATPSALCGEVFSTRVMSDISFVDNSSEQLTARSEMQLAQIGSSYARRDYVAVEVEVSSPSATLAERRAASVIEALNMNGELSDRIVSRGYEGPEGLTLAMKDMRRCN